MVAQHRTSRPHHRPNRFPRSDPSPQAKRAAAGPNRGRGISSQGAATAGLGALGVVFGDIGTSPLYALHTAFSMEHNAVPVDAENLYGVISMVLWTLTLIVTVKYVLLVTRADNHGQGGILALLGLLRSRLTSARGMVLVTVLAMAGAALFFGDSVITPAISVLSAVEGLATVSPALAGLILPAAVAVLLVLFAIQPFGTGRVARALGPIMLGWFLLLAALGLPQIAAHPQILLGLSPQWAGLLLLNHPVQGFILFGAIVLTVTGAEALYADMGLFGARAVRRAWLWVVMPALLLVYLGQGALVLGTPQAVENPMFYLAPPALQVPLVIYATLATVIASQAVIAGAYSVTRQAMRLGLLPRLSVKYTSRRDEEQIYLPGVNWVLLAAVLTVMVVAGSSSGLANAYGLAVTGTLLLESVIFLIFAVLVWRWRWWKVGAYLLAIGLLEVVLLAANSAKLLSGGWVPLALAGGMLVVMTTWQRGFRTMAAYRAELEGSFSGFVEALSATNLRHTAGVAVFPHPNLHSTHLSLLLCTLIFRMLHEQVVIVRIAYAHSPHVPVHSRFEVDQHLSASHGITRITIHTGYLDRQNIPANLALVHDQVPECEIDFSQALYFLSVLTLHSPHPESLRRWRRRLFVALEKNQAPRAEMFQLPPERTIVLGSEVRL
ncbi:potassium transporter Kup [Glutamicibacter creatinolyticus]|uniref:potassium transporter Kup n=1 Tax=Glutamicibacter creatinolyticus TaxID=162496 RepID=UPI0037C05735